MFFSGCDGCSKKAYDLHERRSSLRDISICEREHASDNTSVGPHFTFPASTRVQIGIEDWPEFEFHDSVPVGPSSFKPPPSIRPTIDLQDCAELGSPSADIERGEGHGCTAAKKAKKVRKNGTERAGNVHNHTTTSSSFDHATTCGSMVAAKDPQNSEDLFRVPTSPPGSAKTFRFDLASRSNSSLLIDLEDINDEPRLFKELPSTPKLEASRSIHVVNVCSMASRGTELTQMANGDVVGLGITPFTENFDRHFGLHSQKIVSVLGKEGLSRSPCPSENMEDDTRKSTTQRFSLLSCKAIMTSKSRRSRASVTKIHEIEGCLPEWRDFFQSHKDDPPFWGLQVRFFIKFWEYVCDDLLQYSSCHAYDDDFRHLCLVPSCGWYHAESPSAEKGLVKIGEMKPNMHLVVQRYVKPWTRNLPDAGMSLMFNAGHVSKHRQVGMEELCHASVFISHCWSDSFESFIKTLKKTFDPSTVIWVCSFAIWQHGAIGDALRSLEQCPFALALRSAKRVIVVSDSSVEVLTRCWCVLEAKLSRKWDKSYDIVLNIDGDSKLWKAVERAIEKLDIEQCSATNPEDKVAIVDYARDGEGGISGLNSAVQQAVRDASLRAKLMGAAVSGSLRLLDKVDSKQLRRWRDVRGRGLMHVAATNGQVRALMHLHRRVGRNQLDLRDMNSHSPLCVAAMDGCLSGVQCLLGLKACLDNPTGDNLTPLHFAASGGHAAIVLVLLNAEADVESKGKYVSVEGRRPLHVAAREGRTEVVRVLIQRSAEIDALADNGLSVLFHAVTGEHVHTLATLLSFRADVNLRNGDEIAKTPLFGAVSKNMPEMVSLLLEAAADVNAKDKDGYTCFDYLCQGASHDAQMVAQILSSRIKQSRRCSGCTLL